MEGEIDAGVVPPIFLHNQTLQMARKRDLPWGNHGFHHVLHKQDSRHWIMGSENWNPKFKEWDSVRFSAKPSEEVSEVLVLNNCSSVEQKKNVGESGKSLLFLHESVNEGENLTLKLGGGGFRQEDQIVRANKRIRSGSPGNAACYPMCQVDDCKADLSSAKDYHRRHKVCEVHSKMAKALVAKQMQRFCQQCSRFHPLTEFDEGKRSCRRRLAGHNRRRRKTQPEDPSANILAPGSQDGKASGSVDFVNLVAILARIQGNITGKPTNMSSASDNDQLIHLINKIGSLPPTNPSLKAQVQRGFDLNVLQAPQHSSSEHPSQGRSNQSIPSTMNLLGVLSADLASLNPNVPSSISQESSDGNGSSRGALHKPLRSNDSESKVASMFPSSRDRETSISGHSLLNSSDRPVQIATPCLPLQLFGSAEDDSPPKLGSSIKYPSSESSNPLEDRSPSCSPPAAKRLFPLSSESDKKGESLSTCREDQAVAEASTTCGWAPPLVLFKDRDRQLDNQTVQNMPCSGGYSSSSGSDQSPSSSNCAVQDRTGRIIFKLFDKDPSNLPGTLRTEILNWLSRSPSEIESYIRPGCVVLSVYLCMSPTAWHELEVNLLQRVTSLVNSSDSGFWRNLRFLVRTSRQIVSHKDGKMRVCKSWRCLTAPELKVVSPIAVLSGEETQVVLRGCNLSIPGTKIHCTYKGGYLSKEVLGSSHPGAIYDDCSSESFILPKESPFPYGRYFIEVENGFKGNSFPIIIADAAICEELRSLEVELEDTETFDDISQGMYPENRRVQSRKDTLHFLNELGWLFQRKNHPDLSYVDFATSRFKYLLTFSIDRDFSVLVKKLLDILVERCNASDSVLNESLEILHELQLLSRAVKKKCRKMVELLLNYSVKTAITEDSRMYLFPPNSTGPGGLTPLHLAASTEDAEGMVDALTNDPQGIGLNCWVSEMDDSGQSPSMYASSRNYSYNLLIARKLADKKNNQVSIMIEEKSTDIICAELKQAVKHSSNACGSKAMAVSSCARCTLVESRLVAIKQRRGLLQRPYIHSILAIAAVCVCVCLFFRGAPFVGSIAPFKWENLDFGPR
uniref:SQUAMOSA promoter-binding-like 12 n=1 Tax=Erycina pusilla TaxID=154679 RepID=M9QSC1_9ASPA|nr:SQUAMOSA promoter-binding-like 12 [Erycina pusilla]